MGPYFLFYSEVNTNVLFVTLVSKFSVNSSSVPGFFGVLFGYQLRSQLIPQGRGSKRYKTSYETICRSQYYKEQAGNGISRWDIQGTKIAKRLPSVKYFLLQFSKIEKPKKMDQVARRGPLARAPGALKGWLFRNCQHFRRSCRGDPLEKYQIFEKKSHNAEKLKGGTLWRFSTSILSQNIKKWKGEIFIFVK